MGLEKEEGEGVKGRRGGRGWRTVGGRGGGRGLESCGSRIMACKFES